MMPPRLPAGAVAAFLLLPAFLAALPAAELLPLPAPSGVPVPAAKTAAPYAPQAILPGGVVLPLFPPDSPYLKASQLAEPEVYSYWGPGNVGTVIHIHNPSIEFHPGNGQLNTGAAIILAGGGGNQTLNVGEATPFVNFFAQHGVSTIVVRNRLRSDGYEPRTDGVNDALQAIKLVRAHARDWHLDPHKIGFMGFSAGAELAAGASLRWAGFDRDNDTPDNPLAKVSSRPDFVALIYPGPSPFARGGTPAIPRDMPPAFISCAGWGDWIHALWATEYYDALLKDGVPNVEMHLYARGHHPGDKVGPGEPPATGGLSNMGGIAYGTWSARFLDWFRDLGFLLPPGVETQAARDVAAQLDRRPHEPNGGPPPTGKAP
ncbi:MAG TPA: alpha/beta hydrolase fold domain-containing protein [Lacunisphaera sp.]|nr:alpha/beta hydrolase fold domain-containing protein [Lacunisphaera sp.]